MTFNVVVTPAGDRNCFIDGCEVPGRVYDTLLPSKLFPVETGMSVETALEIAEQIKASESPPEHRGPYLHTAIAGAKPLKSDALGCHTSQIPAIVARNERHGLRGLRYDRAGRPCFTDGAQRKKLMKIESEVMGVKIVRQNSFNGD